MEKPNISKTKTIQMKYPAPYSQSWASPEPERKRNKPKKKTKKNTSLQQNLFPGCCRRSRPKPLHGSDPYAPHLKYGIFPQQGHKSKNSSSNVNENSFLRNTTDLNVASELTNNKGENKKAKKGQLSDTPLFVIRPIDKRHRRQLSMSETLHLDIKPKKSTPRSPLRKYSPLFKNAIPRMNTNIEF